MKTTQCNARRLRRSFRRLALASLLAVLPLSRAMADSPPTGLNEVDQLVPVGNAPADKAFSYVRLEAGVQVRIAGVVKNVLFYGPGVVRVNSNPGVSHAIHPSLVVVAKPGGVQFDVREDVNTLTVVSDQLNVEVDKQTGNLTFRSHNGSLLTRENASQKSEIEERTISNAPTYEIRQGFAVQPDEALYGLGLCGPPTLNRRGQDVLLVQTNIGIVIPLMLSTKHYGIMWDAYSKGTFKDDASGSSYWWESSPAGVDYYFIAGADMDGVIAGYRQLTGPAPMIPKAAFGLFMSKERYHTQDELLNVARTFRREGFPVDYMVQDWQYWGTDHDGLWSGMIWNPERYPNPAAMTKELHDLLHMKLMISIWPSIGNDTELAKELDSKDLRFTPLHWISKQARIYDAYSAEGRQIYFKYIKKGLLDVGVDALWMDGTEVEVGGACHNPVDVENDIKSLGTNAMGDFTRYLNPYTLVTTQGTYEGQRATSDKRVFTLTRSAWTGAQRYSAVSWSGDTTASWQTLKEQIWGGLCVTMAGQPYWTQDTGGFFVNFPGGTSNPEYRELYARWNQFAIFNPIYRIHGTSIDREPYLFKTIDPQIYDSLLSAAQLRYRMLPYIYGLAWRCTDQGYTMMRGLAMDFANDPKVNQINDAYMFGPAMLVHPVTRAMYHISPPPPPVIPAEALHTPDGKPGLAVEYFEGTNFEKSVSTTIDEKVDHTWPGPPLANPPAGLKSLDNFSGRWQGTITASEDGEYEIGVEGDDGYRLWLDGKLVAEDWAAGPARYKGGKITLAKGQQVAVKIEYFQAFLDRVLRLEWRTPSDTRAMAGVQAQLNNTMETYLPAGTDWYDFWTNQRVAGGSTVSKQCTMDQFPIYIRAGSILPLGPNVQYATEKPNAPLEIRVYPGADGTFTLYEDDNETYQYEKGQHVTIPLRWDDGKQTLSIGQRVGEFSGEVKNRELHIVWMADGKSAGAQLIEKADATAQYDGTAVEIKRPAN